MEQISLAPKSSCGCGGHDETLPELDARVIPHAIRHAAIHGVVDSLQPGTALAPHDPIPLIAQIQGRHGEDIKMSYVQQGPEAWKLKLHRA